MLGLLLILRVLLEPTFVIGAGIGVKNFHTIYGSSGVIKSINQQRCNENSGCNVIMDGRFSYYSPYSHKHCIYHCEDTVTLDLKNITEILPTAFETDANFTKVQLLSGADECKTVKLTSQLFRNLANLEDLKLDCSELTPTLDSSETITPLATLVLSRTQFSRTAVDLISNFPPQQLKLLRVNMTTLSPDTFPINSIPSVIMISNNLKVIKDHSFRDRFTNLKELTIVNNKLLHLEPGMFSGLENLTYLNLAGNSIAELRNNPFIALKRLIHLELSRNDLRHLPTGVFKDIKNLKYLTLHSNKLTSVHRNDFEGLGNGYLYLHCNNIHHIEPSAFSGLKLLGNRSGVPDVVKSCKMKARDKLFAEISLRV